MAITEPIVEELHSGYSVSSETYDDTRNRYLRIGCDVYTVRPYERAMQMEIPDSRRKLRSGNTEHRPFWRGLKRCRKP